MGYVTLMASCACCGTLVVCNPNTVPSYHNQPVCKPCILRINQMREAANMDPIPIDPTAYEPLEEELL